MRSKFRSIMGCAFLLLATLPIAINADVATHWNEVAAGISLTPGVRPGPSGVIDMATVQLAIYDAVQSIEGDYEPYCGAVPGASGDVRAAAARAARDVLLNRF